VALGFQRSFGIYKNPSERSVLADHAFALFAGKRHSYDMLRFLLRLVVNSFALAIAVWIVPGLTMRAYAEGEPVVAGGPSLELLLSYLLIALIFGLINGIIGNAIRIVAFPLYVITLGLIALIVNGLLLLLVSQISGWLTFGLLVEDFYSGIIGALVLSLSSWIIGMLLRPLMKKKR
jgi:putative membrane protein